MIAAVRGEVLEIGLDHAVVEVGGAGLAVHATPATLARLRRGEQARLSTSLVVREDSLTLFGFATRDELDVFELLIGVTGVGPKSALGVLSALSPGQVAAAVQADDDAVFRKVSGIGPKTAKLITVSLAGKLVAPRSSPAAPVPIAKGGAAESVLAALTGLGWSERVAADAVEETMAAASDADAASVPALLRLTLSRLGPAQQAGRSR